MTSATRMVPEEGRENSTSRDLLPFWSGQSSSSAGIQCRGLGVALLGITTQAASSLEEVTFESGSIELDVTSDAGGRVLKSLELLPCIHVPQEWDQLTLQKGTMLGLLPVAME